MKITAARIDNFKRVKTIEIKPDGDRSVVLIGGNNAQGKSSVLDALTAAFGGKRSQPADPVRHGEKEAAIFVELDGGKLTIDRTIAPDGSSVLEVRDEQGAVRAPQAMLDRLVGARFLDPLAFLQLAAKEQRAQLMKLIEGADRIDGLNEKRERAFVRRTELGRELAKAEGQLAGLPEVKVGTAIDVAALNDEVKKLAEMQRAGDGLGNVHAERQRETTTASKILTNASDELARIQIEIAKLKEREILLRASFEGYQKDVAAANSREAEAKAKVEAVVAEWQKLAPRRDELDEQLAKAVERNRAVYAAETQMQRRGEARVAVDKLMGQCDDLTKVIAEIDRRKKEILGAAKLPVDGLVVGDAGVELEGVPFEQASDAEKWRVALALAIAASPGLNDVWIRDGALLDDQHLERIAELATAAGKRVWIERVGTRDPGVIEIRDGQVVEKIKHEGTIDVF